MSEITSNRALRGSTPSIATLNILSFLHCGSHTLSTEVPATKSLQPAGGKGTERKRKAFATPERPERNQLSLGSVTPTTRPAARTQPSFCHLFGFCAASDPQKPLQGGCSSRTRAWQKLAHEPRCFKRNRRRDGALGNGGEGSQPRPSSPAGPPASSSARRAPRRRRFSLPPPL